MQSNQVRRNEWSAYAPTRLVQEWKMNPSQTVTQGQTALLINWSAQPTERELFKITEGGTFTAQVEGVYSIMFNATWTRKAGVDSTQGIWLTVNEGVSATTRYGEVMTRHVDPQETAYTAQSVCITLGLRVGDLVRCYAYNSTDSFVLSSVTPVETKIRFEKVY